MHQGTRDTWRIEEILAGKNRDRHFEAFFNLYFDRVVYFFIRRGFDRDESHDLAQETFLRAFQKIEQFRGEGRFVDWLFRIAATIWKNRLRAMATAKRSAVEISLTERHDEERDSDPSQEAVMLGQPPVQLDATLEQERIEVLRQAVLGLPPQMRRCVFLLLDHDLQYPEIAARLQVTIGTVKTQIHLARRRLKDELGSYFQNLDGLEQSAP